MTDAVRCCKLALNHGLGGPLEGPSSYLMKSPPNQVPDPVARQMTEDFIAEYGGALKLPLGEAKAAGSRLPEARIERARPGAERGQRPAAFLVHPSEGLVRPRALLPNLRRWPGLHCCAGARQRARPNPARAAIFYVDDGAGSSTACTADAKGNLISEDSRARATPEADTIVVDPGFLHPDRRPEQRGRRRSPTPGRRQRRGRLRPRHADDRAGHDSSGTLSCAPTRTT